MCVPCTARCTCNQRSIILVCSTKQQEKSFEIKQQVRSSPLGAKQKNGVGRGSKLTTCYSNRKKGRSQHVYFCAYPLRSGEQHLTLELGVYLQCIIEQTTVPRADLHVFFFLLCNQQAIRSNLSQIALFIRDKQFLLTVYGEKTSNGYTIIFSFND